MCSFLWFPHVCFQKCVSFRVIAVSCRSKGVTSFFLEIKNNMRVIACHCRVVSVSRTGVQQAPLRNVSGAFWIFLDNPCTCHFVSILTSLFKLGNILHLTWNVTHAFLLAKNEVRCTTDATRVGLEDFGLELIISSVPSPWTLRGVH